MFEKVYRANWAKFGYQGQITYAIREKSALTNHVHTTWHIMNFEKAKFCITKLIRSREKFWNRFWLITAIIWKIIQELIWYFFVKKFLHFMKVLWVENFRNFLIKSGFSFLLVMDWIRLMMDGIRPKYCEKINLN